MKGDKMGSTTTSGSHEGSATEPVGSSQPPATEPNPFQDDKPDAIYEGDKPNAIYEGDKPNAIYEGDKPDGSGGAK
jgi:hypothetical protein